MGPDDPQEGDYDEETDTYYSERFKWVSKQFYTFLTQGGYKYKDNRQAMEAFLKSQGLIDDEENSEEESTNSGSEGDYKNNYEKATDAFIKIGDAVLPLVPFVGGVYEYSSGQIEGIEVSKATMFLTVLLDGIPGGGACKVQFGKTANQIYHAFRHVDELGLDRAAVQKAILAHFKEVGSQIVSGKPFNQIIEVAGQKIQYTAYKLSDGTINIGRIHGVK